MVSPIRVRVPPLLSCKDLQGKRFALCAVAHIERGIHHNGRSLEVLREEVVQTHGRLAVHGGGDVSVGVGGLLDGGVPEHLRDQLQLLPVLEHERGEGVISSRALRCDGVSLIGSYSCSLVVGSALQTSITRGIVRADRGERLKVIEGDRLGEGDMVRLKRTGEEGRIVHVFATYPFRGDVVVQLGERRDLCSEEEIEKT